ncbi:SpoIIE family protein phosphatase [Bradyrhizobium sp. INPA03-11B]|uniref:PP2C family protein-serine/threonine phosphatase n=1 Tax=Bradyrhizobium sp. INPA03-11B TaxID=418598 RepID=UPI00338F799F
MTAPVTTSGPRILVVDDNDDNRYTLTMYLDLEGYQHVVTANDGEEAVALLEIEPFDLVLLDVMMPRLDGFGVLAWLKAKGRLHHLPVIMISAQNEIENVVSCIELGAVDYLTKPFNKVLLRARLGASLEKKRLRDQMRVHLARLERELDAARALQMGMVPQSFPAPGAAFPWDIHASIAPALEVGGDLYDVFRAPNGDLCFFIGDVSGKGMPAALFMARTKSLIRVVTELTAREVPPDPAAIITRVNAELCDGNDSVMFVTLFFGVLSPGGMLSYCNAGHNPPYRIAGRSITPLVEAASLVLGVEPSVAYRTAHAELAPGEGLFLYTDGVTEAVNAVDEPLGEARLEAALAGVTSTSSAMVATVAADLAAFVRDAPRSDDIAMLALRRIPAALGA